MNGYAPNPTEDETAWPAWISGVVFNDLAVIGDGSPDVINVEMIICTTFQCMRSGNNFAGLNILF